MKTMMASLLAMTLVAAACSSDEGDGDAVATSTPTTLETADDTTTGPDADGADPTATSTDTADDGADGSVDDDATADTPTPNDEAEGAAATPGDEAGDGAPGGDGGDAGRAVTGQADPSLPGQLIQSGYDGPFFMVNLIEFRDQAVYADGRETDLTGVEANNLYGQTGVQLLIEGGMRPALAGAVDAGSAADPVTAWDQVAIARYPSYQEFFALSQSAEFQVGVEHKDAGVAATIVMPTLRVEDGPLAVDLPAAEDPVVLFEVFSHDGDGTAGRPEPLAEYLGSLAAAAPEFGGVALGTYEVQGVLIGDGRTWDEAHVWWFADRAELEALLADADLAASTEARDEVLTDHYRLVLDDVLVEPLGHQP